jgi:hypothetical protein
MNMLSNIWADERLNAENSIVHQLDVWLAPYCCQFVTDLAQGEKENIIISKMDRCRTLRFPAHSALRFSWPEGFLLEAVL